MYLIQAGEKCRPSSFELWDAFLAQIYDTGSFFIAQKAEGAVKLNPGDQCGHSSNFNALSHLSQRCTVIIEPHLFKELWKNA